MSNTRPKQASSSRILSQLGATAASISNALHQVRNAITARLNPTSETRVLHIDPEGKIPDEEFDRDMREQEAFMLRSNTINNALADIDLVEKGRIALLPSFNNELTIYYDANKHPDESALKQLIVEKLPEFNINLKIATSQQIADDNAFKNMRFIMY